MTVAAVKQRLHDIIEHADSKKLKAIYTLLENDSEEDNYALNASIQRGIEDLEKGLTRPHEEVMAGIRKHYKL